MNISLFYLYEKISKQRKTFLVISFNRQRKNAIRISFLLVHLMTKFVLFSGLLRYFFYIIDAFSNSLNELRTKFIFAIDEDLFRQIERKFERKKPSFFFRKF